MYCYDPLKSVQFYFQISKLKVNSTCFFKILQTSSNMILIKKGGYQYQRLHSRYIFGIFYVVHLEYTHYSFNITKFTNLGSQSILRAQVTITNQPNIRSDRSHNQEQQDHLLFLTHPTYLFKVLEQIL